jgi:YidC/Oxa1 family membrane protein insertase
MGIENWSPLKRGIVLVVLTVGFLVLYSYIMQKWFPPPPVPAPGPPQPVKSAAGSPPPAPPPEGEEAWPSSPIAADRVQTFHVRTQVFDVTGTNRGGYPTSWKLLRYKDLHGQPLELIPQYASAWRPLRILDAEGRPIDRLDKALYRTDLQTRPDGTVQLTLEYADAVDWVRKRMVFRPDAYHVDLQVLYRSRSASGTRVYIVWAPGLEHSTPQERKAAGWSFHAVSGLYRDDKARGVGRKKDLHDIREGLHARWVGLHSNYFLVAFLAPDATTLPGALFSTHVLGAPPGQKWPDPPPAELEANLDVLMVLGVPLRPGEPARWTLYVGPKDLGILTAVDPTLGEAIQYGMFGFIAKGLLALLKFCYRLIPNYGVAIILATLLVRLLLWPLSHRMFINSEKMKAVQPKIKALQEKYKGIPLRDPRRQKMNEELMRIYREHGVNPMSGCLPLLLQLPILFAFYNLLSVSIELRQAPFVLWIRDLSRPDPYLITPILMGITMILQQKLTPTTMDPTQQRLGYLMSGLFVFMFMNAQSGLVLYWLFSNVFSIAQQYLYHRFYFRTTPAESVRRQRLKATQAG